MARVEKNAAGEDVRVDTPAFGCITIEAAAPTKSKAKPAASEPDAADEGAE
jgi:hypothetical protein